jgi:hypothetical protein
MGSLAVILSRMGGSFILYAMITAFFFRALLPHLGSALLGPPEDNLQDFWNSWYAAVGHTGGASFFFTDTIKFPEGTTLYYHSFAYPQVFLVWLGTKLFGTSLPTLTLLQNSVLLLSFPLAGTGVFCLARHVTGSTWSALLGGFVFAFNPSHMEHAMHHLHVASIEFIPFFVLSYWLAFERRSAAWLMAAIMFHALSALSCWYYLFYCGYFVTFHTIYHWVRTRIPPRGWALYAPFAEMGGVIVILSPWLVPMVREASAGANVYKDGINTFVADILAYFSFPPHHILAALTEPLYRHFSGNDWESTVYLGFPNIALSVWLFLNRQQSDRRMIEYLAVGIAVFAACASGSFLHFLGYAFFPMPDLLLSEVPFFRNIRAPSRAIVLVYLLSAVIVSMALKLLTRQSEKSPVLRRIMVTGILALIVVDFYPVHLDMTPFSCSSGLAVIRDDPERGFGILNLPGSYFSDNAAMAEQICHERPIIRGKTSREVTRTLRDFLETRDLEEQRRQLVSARVKYIVLRRADSEIYQWRVEDGVREDYPRTYRTVYADAELIILRVY